MQASAAPDLPSSSTSARRPSVLSWWLLVSVAAAFVLAPFAISVHMGRKCRVNTPLLDDWAYVPLYEKAIKGGLTMHDFFGGYLEHRPAVARVIAIVTTLATGGDLRSQPVVAFVAISLSWIFCGIFLRRAIPQWRSWWLPFGLTGWIMFCPVQWQEFLWASCHMDTLPLLFLTTAMLALRKESWSLRVRLVLCFACAWLATYSFAAGLTLWVFIPAAALCGLGIPVTRDRIRFVVMWAVPMAIVLFAYFHDLKNEVESPFAYGQGHEDTMTHSVWTVIQHPEKGVKFLVTLLGANFSRGVFGVRPVTAFWLGTAALSVLVVALLVWTKHWRKLEDRVAALPFAFVSCYGVAVAGMVASGRAWASRDVGGALNNRYACFATAFAAGLAGFVAVLRHQNASRQNRDGSDADAAAPAALRIICPGALASCVPTLAGIVAGLLIANWCYGLQMMMCWKYARTRGAVDIHFSPFFGLSQDRGGPAQHIHLAVPRAETMDKLGLLHPPLAKSLSLSEFHRLPRLPDRLARIDGTNRRSTGPLTIYGVAMLDPIGRPADAVLVTMETDQQKEPTIIQVTLPDGLPPFWHRDTTKDLQYVVANDSLPQRFGDWEAVIDRNRLPAGRVRLRAWALDFPGMNIREIDQGVNLAN